MSEVFPDYRPIPEPASRQPYQCYTDQVADQKPLGVRLLDDVDPERVLLSEAQQRKVLNLNKNSAIMELLQADLGDATSPNVARAYEVFGDLLKLKIEIPSLILTMRFYTMFQCMMCLDDNRKLTADKKLPPDERVSANKAAAEMIARMDFMLTSTQRLAEKLAKEKSKEKQPVRKPVTGMAPSLE